MPLYEYACHACGHRFEELVRSGDEVACPACRGAELERLFSAFAVPGNTAEPTLAIPGASGCGRCGDPGGPGSCGRN